ncbi:hypothetical protein BCQ_0990 [Bacillus cereus Q1]|uniref:Lipoprotein n=1 Tax=Bacillus cereus (strain Q1) TaxID=361100 RepID=B9IS58_BACCQ|nr:hypothetical protein BCQ_0990 [Bacillus cereus Q1]
MRGAAFWWSFFVWGVLYGCGIGCLERGGNHEENDKR